MGSGFSQFFGGGSSVPDPVPVAPAPEREEITEDESTRNAELRKLRAKSGGVKSTLLGAKLGGANGGSNSMGLLGRSI